MQVSPLVSPSVREGGGECVYGALNAATHYSYDTTVVNTYRAHTPKKS